MMSPGSRVTSFETHSITSDIGRAMSEVFLKALRVDRRYDQVTMVGRSRDPIWWSRFGLRRSSVVCTDGKGEFRVQGLRPGAYDIFLLSSERVEIYLVLPEMLEILQATAAGEHVERDVQDVIGLVVGQVDLEELDAAVDLLD